MTPSRGPNSLWAITLCDASHSTNYGVEVWRPTPQYEGLYQVSNRGRIRSLYFSPARLCKLGTDSHGYPTIAVTKARRRTTKTVHRLVAIAFRGSAQNALHNEVAHLDGNHKDPHAHNLRWVSKIENESHKTLHGTRRTGERCAHAKLTEVQVRRIRTRYASAPELAAEYGVSRHTIYDLWRNRNWLSVLPSIAVIYVLIVGALAVTP